jgi:secretion/DNA translocation related TadE-like protein
VNRADGGFATVWAAAAVGVLVVALVLGLHLGSAVVARHRAESAADLAALAGAADAVLGRAAACDRAGRIAAAGGAELTACALAGWDVLVEVRTPIPFRLDAALGTPPVATARARAGPVDPDGADPADPDPADVDPADPADAAPVTGRRSPSAGAIAFRPCRSPPDIAACRVGGIRSH